MRNKRIISMLLTIAMIFSFIPFSMATVSAAETPATFEAVNVDLEGTEVVASEKNNKYLVFYGAKNNTESITLTFTLDEELEVGKQYAIQFRVRDYVDGAGSRKWRSSAGNTKVGGASANGNQTSVVTKDEVDYTVTTKLVPNYGVPYTSGKWNTTGDWDGVSGTPVTPIAVPFIPTKASNTVAWTIQFGGTSEPETTPFCLDDIRIVPCEFVYSEIVYDTAKKTGSNYLVSCTVADNAEAVFEEDFDSADFTAGAEFSGSDNISIKLNPAYGAAHTAGNPKNQNIQNDPSYEANKATWDEALAKYNTDIFVTNADKYGQHGALYAMIGQETDGYQIDIADGEKYSDTSAAGTVIPAGKYKLTALVRNDEYNAYGTRSDGYSTGNWMSHFPASATLDSPLYKNDGTTINNIKTDAIDAVGIKYIEDTYGIKTYKFLYQGNHYGKIFENLNNFNLTATIVTANGEYEADAVNLNYLWTEYVYEFEVPAATTLESIDFAVEHAKSGEAATLGYQSITLEQVEAKAEPLAVELFVDAPETANAGDTIAVNVLATTSQYTTNTLNALNFVVDYDDTVLKLVSIEPATGVGGTAVDNGAAYGWNGGAEGGVAVKAGDKAAVATITFEVLNAAEAGKTKITLGDSTDDSIGTKLNAKILGVAKTFIPEVTEGAVEIINNAEVAITVAPKGYGTVSADSAAAPVGSKITVDNDGVLHVGDEEIIAEEGDLYVFDGWYIGETKIDANGVEVTTNADIAITAQFVIGSGKAVVTVEPTEGGTVTGAEVGADIVFNAGTVFTVNGAVIKVGEGNFANAAANEGYKFLGWFIGNEAAPATVTLSKNATINFVAMFDEVGTVSIASDANAGVAEKTFYVYNDKLYNDEACTDLADVSDLPTITPAAAADNRYVLADETNVWIVNGAAMTADDIFAGNASAIETITANIKKQYLLTFTIDAGSASILSFKNAENATLWADENAEGLAFPELNKTNDYYDIVWTPASIANVTAPATYTAKAEVKSITHTVVYKNANGNADLTIEDAHKATVVGGIGENLVITPKGIPDYVIESVTADGLELEAANGVYTSKTKLEAPATVTVKYRAYYVVTVVDNDKATVEDATYVAKDGEAGLYTDNTFTNKVTALPAIIYATATSDTRYVAATPVWLVDDVAKTAEDILGATYTAATEIKPAFVTEYKITFAVDANSADVLEIASADAETWLAAGKTVAFPTVTVKNSAYTYKWNVENITSIPVEGPAAYVATAIAGSTQTIVNYVDANAPSENVTVNAATVVDVAGAKLVITPAALEGWYVEDVTATVGGAAFELTGANGVWTSTANIEAQATVTIAYREIIEVTVKSDDEGAAITEVKYFAKDGIAGLYKENTFVTAVTEDDLKVTYTVGANEQWIAANEGLDFVMNETAVNAETIIENVYTADTAITTNAKQQFRITFKVAEGSAAVITALDYTEKWIDANTAAPDYPGYTVAEAIKNYYTYAWEPDSITTPVTAAGSYTITATPKTYNVTVTGALDGQVAADANATYGTDYTFTVNKSDDYNTVVKVNGDVVDTYTIAGANITDDIEIVITNTVDVTVVGNDNVTVADNTKFTVAYGEKLTADNITAIGAATTPATGYALKGWIVGDAADAVETLADITFTKHTTVKPVVEIRTVKATFVSANEEQGTVTVAEKVVNANSVITADGAVLKIGDVELTRAEAKTGYKFAGWYLNEEADKFATATVDADKTYKFTAKFEADTVKITLATAENADFAAAEFTVTVGKGFSEADLATVKAYKAKAGYTLAGWTTTVGGTTAEVTDFTSVTFDGAKTYYPVIVKSTFEMTVPAGVSVKVNDKEAVAGGTDVKVSVQIGDTVVITPNADTMVIGVAYNGNALTASEGKYTVPADKITAAIEITVTAVDYYFITAEQYRALESDDYKILAIKATANDKDYTYGDYEFYYSSKYEAYVAIIGAELTAAQIGQTITSAAGSETALKYNGDVNGDGMTSAADAAIVSEILHAYKNGTTEYTDIMRLEADVFGEYTEGGAYVTVSDCTCMLYKSVGLDYTEKNGENDGE